MAPSAACRSAAARPERARRICSTRVNMVDKVNAVGAFRRQRLRPRRRDRHRQVARGASHRLGRAHDQGADRAGGDPLRPAGRRQPEDPPDRGLRLQGRRRRHERAGLEGTVGAGAGATVGKIGGGKRDEGGLGSYASRMPNGLIVGAIVAVNAVGDIIDPDTGKVIAGVRKPDGTLADARQLLRSGRWFADRRRAARGREHDDRPGRDQREADQGRGQPRGADGRRWVCAGDLSVAHDGRRRHACSRWRPANGPARRTSRRSARSPRT